MPHGAFWQPKRVYADLSLLATLPERELKNGMAEVDSIIPAAVKRDSAHLGDQAWVHSGPGAV